MKNIIRIVMNSFIVVGLFLILNTSISAEESDWTVAFENESMRLLTQGIEDTASVTDALTQAQSTFSHWFESPQKIAVAILAWL